MTLTKSEALQRAADLEREAEADANLAEEHAEDNPTYSDGCYRRANWKRYLAREERVWAESFDEEPS